MVPISVWNVTAAHKKVPDTMAPNGTAVALGGAWSLYGRVEEWLHTPKESQKVRAGRKTAAVPFVREPFLDDTFS